MGAPPSVQLGVGHLPKEAFGGGWPNPPAPGDGATRGPGRSPGVGRRLVIPPTTVAWGGAGAGKAAYAQEHEAVAPVDPLPSGGSGYRGAPTQDPRPSHGGFCT